MPGRVQINQKMPSPGYATVVIFARQGRRTNQHGGGSRLRIMHALATYNCGAGVSAP